LIQNLKNLTILPDKDLVTKPEFIILLRKKYYESLNLPENWKKVLVDIPHYTLREQLILPFIIKREKPDIVHFPHLNIPYFYSGKFIITIHDLTMQKQGLNATKLPIFIYLLKRIPFLLISKKAVKDAVKIIVPSKTTAIDIANYYDISIQKIKVTYEGYDYKNISETKFTGEMSVLTNYGLVNKSYFFYLGNAYPHKNLEIVIKAIKDLNQNKKMESIFVIAGLRDGFRKRLENFIHDINADKYVSLVGFVKDGDLPILYKNSLGFVYPSLSEGFGLQGLEAIAAGTTLACSNIPVFKEIYEFHAFYFDPKDLTSISSTLYSIYNLGKEEKHRYIRSAQAHIKRYSWQKMAEDTLSIYQGV
jgi:glycosyltransferase involved in cell wall biosynthesis